MVVNFNDFVAHTESVVRDVLAFVGADPERLNFKPLPPSMQVMQVGWLVYISIRMESSVLP